MKQKKRQEKNYYISCGAGKNQLPLIQAALKQDYQVIGIDRDMNSPGMELCNIKIEESVMNFRKIHRKLLMLPINMEISGGFSASFGRAILSWAYIVERFNLEGITRPLAEALTNKWSIRSALEKAKIKNANYNQPRFTNVGSRISLKQLKEKIGFPMIIKPQEGFAKKRIFLINTYQDLKKFLDKNFLKKLRIDPRRMIFENFVRGSEFIVVGFIQNFCFHLISISDKLTSPYPPFIDIEHTAPSIFCKLRKEIKEIHQQITDALQIPCSPIVSEWKYVKGKLYLIEISPQIPGEYLSSFLILNSFKYDYFANLVKLTTGETIEVPDWEKINLSEKSYIKYWVNKPPLYNWEKWQKKSSFDFVLNENPDFPPKSNHDRYGVMGFTQKDIMKSK